MYASHANRSPALCARVQRRLLAIMAVSLVLFIRVEVEAQQTERTDESRSGTITGRVVNESGQPMVGATVFVRAAGGGSTLNRNTSTNTEGDFQLAGLEHALYYITASSPAYVSPPFDPDAPISTYRVGDSVRLELMRGGVITGTVTNAAGEPVVGVRVRALMVRDQNGKPLRGRVPGWGERQTDDRGIYRIYGLGTGTFIVQAGGGGPQGSMSVTDFDAPTYAPSSTRDSAAEIQVRSGEETTVDIRYRADPGHSISGTVKLQGTSGANLSLVQVGEETIPTNSTFQTPGARGFTIYGVGDGDYQLMAQEVVGQITNVMTTPGLAVSDPVKVSVRGADVAGLELTTKPLASISGRVALEPSKLQECENKRQPLFAETLVLLVQDKKESQKDPFGIMRLFTGLSIPDKEGAISLKNIRPGAYSFTPQFVARYWYLKSITVAPPSQARQPSTTRDAARNWLPIKSGEQISGLTITLSEGAGSLRGQIEVAEDSTLEPGTLVYLVPADRDKVDDSLRYFVDEVSSDRNFSIGNIPPGRYLLLAQQPLESVPTTTDKLRLPDATEARTKLRRAAESRKSEVELKPCQSVTDFKLVLKTQ